MTNADYGVCGMVGPLKRVALCRPTDALLNADTKKWHYGPTHSAAGILREYAGFVSLLEKCGTEILWIDAGNTEYADSVFPYDPSIMTPEGAILLQSGKALRRGEEAVHRTFYQANNIPVLGAIQGNGLMDGGDTLWLAPDLLAVGRGYRTNQDGINQLSALLKPMGVAVRAFDMPVYHGAAACLHIMSLVSPVDRKKALVLAHLMPVGLYTLMQELGYQMIEAPLDEFDATNTISLNILATAPGECLMAEGAPKTLALLHKAGVSVQTFSGDVLCKACEGGPTCMTRPVLRAG